MEKVSMMVDDREIKAIFWHEGQVVVGERGVTQIKCYREGGQMGYVPWFAEHHGSEIAAKYNGAMLEGVSYFTNEEQAF